MELTVLDTADLPARDAGLAAAIDHAVARRWLTLVTVLEHALDRRWDELEPSLQAVLLAGAAQLLLLDRVPDHAAINEAVDLAKRLVRPRSGGLVNAVLRKVSALREEIVETTDPDRRDELPLHDGRAWRLRAPVFADDPVRRLAQRTSHGAPLISHWQATFGAKKCEALAAHSLVHAPIIIAGLAGTPDGCTPHREPGFHVFGGGPHEIDRLLEEQPGALVQDPSTARPVEATAGLRANVIVDACAGKGTKTRQLARLHPHARVVATDIDPKREAFLRDALASCSNVEVIAHRDLDRLRGGVDLLVLDVPCTNTGVLARRVEAKYRFSRETLAQLRDLQRQIIADSLTLLADNGHILYATCSISPEENGRQADWITKWHPMRVVASADLLPSGGPGEPASSYSDGGSYALLERIG